MRRLKVKLCDCELSCGLKFSTRQRNADPSGLLRPSLQLRRQIKVTAVYLCVVSQTGGRKHRGVGPLISQGQPKQAIGHKHTLTPLPA